MLSVTLPSGALPCALVSGAANLLTGSYLLALVAALVVAATLTLPRSEASK